MYVHSSHLVCLGILVFYQAGFQEPQILVPSALQVARGLLGSSHLATNMTCVYVPQYIYKTKMSYMCCDVGKFGKHI